jgi:general secretion pathway protein I
MSKPSSLNAERRQAGFTLIEILVAFTVAALLLAGIYEVFSRGVRATAVSRKSTEALMLAQSSLDATTGVPVAPGQTHEVIGDFERFIDVRPRSDLLPPNGQISVMPYEVVVRVAWRDGVRPRDVSLSTIWLGPPLKALSSQSAP